MLCIFIQAVINFQPGNESAARPLFPPVHDAFFRCRAAHFPPNRDIYSRYIVHTYVYKMQNDTAIAIINIQLSHKSDFNGILCGVFSA